MSSSSRRSLGKATHVKRSFGAGPQDKLLPSAWRRRAPRTEVSGYSPRLRTRNVAGDGARVSLGDRLGSGSSSFLPQRSGVRVPVPFWRSLRGGLLEKLAMHCIQRCGLARSVGEEQQFSCAGMGEIAAFGRPCAVS